MEQSLEELLRAYDEKQTCKMHMPGHKQKSQKDDFWTSAFSLDVTEVGDFDDLHAPEGILKRSMELAARVWGAERSFYLVGSSTAGILAGISAVLKQAGRTVLLARNCHKSVYHACEWMQAKTKFVCPPWDSEAAVFSSLPPEAVEQALEQEPDVALVVICSPTYEGVISDVASIARICHRRGVPLMVDEAHGAHLGHWGIFPESAVAAGADLVVQSLHKTLPCLTQTGILHARWDRVEEKEVKRRLQMAQSSSPSYLLMASMDRCVRWLAEGQREQWEAWKARCLELRSAIGELKHLRVAVPTEGVFATDPSKIAVQDSQGRYTGKELAEALEKAGIFCEMSLGPNVLLYTGAGTEDADCRRVLQALRELDGREAPKACVCWPCPSVGEAVMPLSAALCSPWEERDYAEAEGEISAEYLWAYPPGIPLLCPGERIGRETVAYLLAQARYGCRLLSGGESSRGRIRVVKKKEK